MLPWIFSSSLVASGNRSVQQSLYCFVVREKSCLKLRLILRQFNWQFGLSVLIHHFSPVQNNIRNVHDDNVKTTSRYYILCLMLQDVQFAWSFIKLNHILHNNNNLLWQSFLILWLHIKYVTFFQSIFVTLKLKTWLKNKTEQKNTICKDTSTTNWIWGVSVILC